MSIAPIGARIGRIPAGRALVPVAPARAAENEGARARSQSLVVRDFARTAYGSPDLAARTRAACEAYQSRGSVTLAVGGRLGILV